MRSAPTTADGQTAEHPPESTTCWAQRTSEDRSSSARFSNHTGTVWNQSKRVLGNPPKFGNLEKPLVEIRWSPQRAADGGGSDKERSETCLKRRRAVKSKAGYLIWRTSEKIKTWGLWSKNQVNSTIKSTKMFSLFSVVSLPTYYSVFCLLLNAVLGKIKILVFK